MGGLRSWAFLEFKRLMIKGFLALRAQRGKIVQLVEMAIAGGLIEIDDKDAVLLALESRFVPEKSVVECREFVLSMIEHSCDNWSTVWYDKYQKYCVGIW